MDFELRQIDDDTKIKISKDNTVVFNRPKSFVGSSGSVWASEYMRLRFEEPRLFLASENNNDDAYNYDKELTGALIKLMDRMKQFSIMTVKGDIMNVTVSDQKCPFRIYELERLRCLKLNIDEFCSETLDHEGTKLEDDLKAVKDSIGDIEEQYKASESKGTIWESTSKLCYLCCQSCKKIISRIPSLKSRIHEFTDGGPGVGVSNHDVKYRVAEVIMVTDPDYYIRHHLANGDSSHNEVGRIQSYVGDAICDGGPLEWEYKKNSTKD